MFVKVIIQLANVPIKMVASNNGCAPCVLSTDRCEWVI